MNLLGTEYAIINALQSVSNPIIDMLFIAFSFLGSPILWIGIAALLYWKGKPHESFMLINLVALAGAVTSFFKLFFGRLRPSQELVNRIDLETLTNLGFPSGHSAMIAGVFGFYEKKLKANKKMVLAGIVLLVAISRIYLGVHFPSDVIAGIVLGYLIGRILKFADSKTHEAHFAPTKMQEEILVLLLLAIAVTSIFFFNSIPLALILIGYYAGFFTMKEFGHEPVKQSGKAELLGFTALFLLTVPHYLQFIQLHNIVSSAAFFFGGAWISLIWPLAYEKLLKKR
jgi:membrane-associated phospholipid phosphatase